jgi:D-3-phosphoglycerate dehydrogenase
MKILVADGLAEEGLLRLQDHGDVSVHGGLTEEALEEAIVDVDALIVRSRTRVTREAIARATRLRVIARAGVGIDNIEIDAATRRGILVLNAPESSTVSTAEHTLAMLLSLARQIPSAHLATSQGGWRRERFTGIELYGKTLGVIGLGKIGGEVARRAAAFGMRVIAFDPYVSPDRASRIGAELVPWDALLERSNVITLHVPLSQGTRYLIGAAELDRMRSGVRIINCARGGLIDEQALLAALEEGHVAGAALDVFEEEPPQNTALVAHPRVIVTPHLGAATEEAQRTIALEIADQVVAALAGRPVRGVVNAVALPEDVWVRLHPYVDLMRVLGAVACQLAEGQIRGLEFVYEGEVAAEKTDHLQASFLVGFLEMIVEPPVNAVNAALIAKDRGITLSEQRRDHSDDFSSLIQVRVETTGNPFVLGGTLFGKRDPRITHVNDYRIDLVPAPYMLFVWNVDRPGMIGRVGTILGAHQVNIAGMQVGRNTPHGTAVMVLALDSPVPLAALRELAQVEGITSLKDIDVHQTHPQDA